MSRPIASVPTGYRAKAVYQEDIARAMELHHAGATEQSIYAATGVTPMDITFAEIMGFDAYPSRTNSPTPSQEKHHE